VTTRGTTENQTTKEELAKEISANVVNQLKEGETIGTPPLEPITPSEAWDRFLKKAKNTDGNSGGTLDTYNTVKEKFVEWCNLINIDNMNDVTGRDLDGYRQWRAEEIKPISANNDQKILRSFIKYCGIIDAVPTELHRKVVVPKVDSKDETRDEMVTGERAEKIIEFLSKYEYASRDHVTWVLLMDVGIRISSLRSLDECNFDNSGETPTLKFEHSPDEGTPLKNGKDSERVTSISQNASKVLKDYIADQREEVEDEYDREPLVSTKNGRVGTSTVRKTVYKWTRPCAIGNGCPKGKNPDECEAAQENDKASKCPFSLSPHPVRRGYITYGLRKGVPVQVLSKRCDVSVENIYKHYDARTPEEEMEQRKEKIESAIDDKCTFRASSRENNSASD